MYSQAADDGFTLALWALPPQPVPASSTPHACDWPSYLHTHHRFQLVIAYRRRNEGHASHCLPWTLHMVGCCFRNLLPTSKLPHPLNHWSLYYWTVNSRLFLRNWSWANTGLYRPAECSPAEKKIKITILSPYIPTRMANVWMTHGGENLKAKMNSQFGK